MNLTGLDRGFHPTIDKTIRDKGLIEEDGSRGTGWEMSVVALGEPYFVTSLRAAGVDGRAVGDAREAEEAVELLVREDKCKVIVVPERLAVMLEHKRDELARRGIYYPVFAVVPDMDERAQERTHRLYQLISQAVGARLKLGED